MSEEQGGTTGTLLRHPGGRPRGNGKKVIIAVPSFPPSKSRNVNRAVRAALTVKALGNAFAQAQVEVRESYAALNGGQLAEVQRILKGEG